MEGRIRPHHGRKTKMSTKTQKNKENKKAIITTGYSEDSTDRAIGDANKRAARFRRRFRRGGGMSGYPGGHPGS